MQCRIWFNKKVENDKRRVLGPCVTYRKTSTLRICTSVQL